MPAELSTTESCCMGMTKECQLWKLSQPVYKCADCYQKLFLCIILSSMQIQYHLDRMSLQRLHSTVMEVLKI